VSTTDRVSIAGSQRSGSGYWRLAPAAGEGHIERAELIGGTPVNGAGSDAPGRPLLSVGHLSDLHLCDSQSPARAEFLDRWADDDAPTKAELPAVGSYRAQDCLTVQVAAAMVQALNAVAVGPVGGAPLDWAITTGDVTDNAQTNELGWYIGVLDGGEIVPDSGDLARYEGVADNAYWDEAFWHPEPSGRADRPHRLHGFPDVAGLLDALRQPFTADGLSMPWLAVHGNHDQMIQGTIPAVGPFAAAAIAASKVIGLPEHWSTAEIVKFCHDVDNCRLHALGAWATLPTRLVTGDPHRATINRADFIAAHFQPAARPLGHGFGADAIDHARAYYRYDHGRVSVLVLDTVNEHGGWHGSLDAGQLEWLDAELTDADRERRYVVLASHHPLHDLINPTLPAELASIAAQRRILFDELTAVLQRHPSLVLWLNGHTHRTTVTAHPGWWEVTAPSLIDFPQQGRIVELLEAADGGLTIAATMLDHDGELPWTGSIEDTRALAGLSRELAANDWQRRVADLSAQWWAGTRSERNVLLYLPAPF
jgi:metallophosphoesterase (TIGR03767 family)